MRNTFARQNILILVLLLIGNQGMSQDLKCGKFCAWKVSYTPNKMVNIGCEFGPTEFNSFQADLYFGNANLRPQLFTDRLYHSEGINRIGFGLSYRRYLVPFQKHTVRPYLSLDYMLKREIEKTETIVGYTSPNWTTRTFPILSHQGEEYLQQYIGASFGFIVVKKIKQFYIIPIDIRFGTGILFNADKTFRLSHGSEESRFARKVSKTLIEKSTNQEYFPFKSAITKTSDLLFFQVKVQIGIMQFFIG